MKTKYYALISAIVAVTVVSGCSTNSLPLIDGANDRNYERPVMGSNTELVWSSHKERPAWTIEQPVKSDEGYLLFVGESSRFATEKSAKRSAELDGSAKASKFFSNNTEIKEIESRKARGNADEQLNAAIQSKTVTTLHSNAMVSKLEPRNWYFEQWRNEQGKIFWKAFVLLSLDESESSSVLDRLKPSEAPVTETLDFDRFKENSRRYAPETTVKNNGVAANSGAVSIDY